VLLAADLGGLLAAFVVTQFVLADVFSDIRPDVAQLFVFFLASLPVWAIAAHFYGLYDRDDERTDHSTSDDVTGVFHLVTVGVWILYAGAWVTGITTPNVSRTTLFWALAIVFITTGRALGRSLIRRTAGYVQNAVIVGGGEVGQLVARKYLLHPEYGIRLLGLVDDDPLDRREELRGIDVWPPDRLLELVEDRKIDRVLFAFDQAPNEDTLARIRQLRELNVQIDIVPRLFEVMPPQRRRPLGRGAASPQSAPGAAVPFLEARQARLRHRRIERAPAPHGSTLRDLRLADQARLARAGVLSADAARPRHGGVHGAQVPHDDGRAPRRRTPGIPEVDHELERHCRRQRALQARAAGRRHRCREVAPQDIARRAPSAAERA